MAPEVYPNPVFEGSEKRLEIDFLSRTTENALSLRDLSRDQLDTLMTLAACTIVSSRSNNDFDAYVLSESSLFVYPTKWILKTCGTTKLLNSVPLLLSLAKKLGLTPCRCKFSRACYLFPENQPSPHMSFEEEVGFLDDTFKPFLGESQAFKLGNPEAGLQWHVYVAGHCKYQSTVRSTFNIEICMTELSRPASMQFYRRGKNAADVSKESGIVLLKPKAWIDDYVFEPCGYSMNGIDGTGLITIHITPEEGFSYASLEVSGFSEDLEDPNELLASAVKIFEPGKITMALTVQRGASDGLSTSYEEFCNLSYIPTGYGCYTSSCQGLPSGGKVSCYNLALTSPGSPVTVLHGTSSSSTSDSDAEADVSFR